MSYIKHKDRVFLKNGQNAVRKRSDCNLRKISSCSDVRAWSMSAEDRRQYFLDNVSSKSSSSFGKYVPPDVIVDILRKQNINQLKKLNSLKRCSSEELLKKKDGFQKKKVKCSAHSVKSSEDDLKIKYESELGNLRSMVNDLEGKLSSMKALEDENLKLKTQINIGIKKIENFETIGPLVPKNCLIRNEKCEHLSEAIDAMRDQCKKMQLNMDYLQTKNYKLSNKLKITSSSEKHLKDRQLTVSLETVNNAILKNKVTNKDMKIQKLEAVNQDQKIEIENLICHINELCIHFSWKEEVLTGKLLEFKNLVKAGHKKVTEYENLNTLYQSIIIEMDVLRDYFKGVNAALKDEALYYKNNLRKVAMKVFEMAAKVECLLNEISKRDAKIKELSRFPGRAALAVRISQLDQILNSDFLFVMDKNSVVETFERLKRILLELKRDSWDSYGFDCPLSFSDGCTQYFTDYKDSSSQSAIFVSDLEVQTVYPDEFISKFITYNIFISVFNRVIRRTKLYLKKEQLVNRDLKEQLDELTEFLKRKNTEVETLTMNNISLQNNLDILKKAACEGNCYTESLFQSSDSVINAYESLNNLFDYSLVCTIKEYNDYSFLVEDVVRHFEEKLCQLIEIIEFELEDERWQHFSYLYELEKKNDLLNETLTQEFNINTILLREVDGLSQDLKEKDDFINELKDFWMFAEYEKTQLINQLTARKENFDFSSQIILDLTDNESMTDLNTLGNTKMSVDKMVETNFEMLPLNKLSNLKRSFRTNLVDSNVFYKKMSRVNFNVKRIKSRIFYLRNKLELSIEALNKLKESNSCLTEINKNLTSENLRSKNKIVKLQDCISNLKDIIQSESLKNNKLQNDQITFFNDFHRIQLELMDLKESSNRRMSENSINTEVTMSGFELLLLSKDECIKQLKERIEKLLDLLKDIEEEKKNKEDNSVCRYIQCDFENDSEEQYKVLILEMKDNYENIINNMKVSFSEEKDTKEKYFRNNLSLLKDTYERDIKRIKAANAESLRKIQHFHEDELRTLKQSQEEVKSKNETIDGNFIQEKHSLEIEQLRINYEKMIKEKSELFLKEKEHLQEEMKKYMSEKESQVEEITKRMELGIKTMKKKCKQHMKKLQKQNCCALEDIRKQCNVLKVDDASSIDMSDGYSLSQDKEYSVAESEDTICAKDDCDTTSVDVKTDTSGFDEDHYDCVVVDERRFLLKRIEQLEDQLAEKEAQSSENACDSEKRVWLERERCRETRKLLDKEVERNEKLKSMLKDEKNRADNLAMLNQALLIKLQSMEMGKQENTVNSITNLKSERVSIYNYDELSGNYTAHMKSQFTRTFGPNNFKLI